MRRVWATDPCGDTDTTSNIYRFVMVFRDVGSEKFLTGMVKRMKTRKGVVYLSRASITPRYHQIVGQHMDIIYLSILQRYGTVGNLKSGV